MDLLTRRKLQELTEAEQNTAVSIYIPTQRTGREIRQNDLRWKNALKSAEEQLRSAGLTGGNVNKLLDEPRQLVSDTAWWESQDEGLAAFIAPGRFERYRLPLRFDEVVIVAPRFHVRPILPLFEGDGRFYILAVSQNSVRLAEATRYTVSELDPRGLPKNMRDALDIDEYVSSLQHHEGEKGRLPGKWGIFHGQGGSNLDVQKADEIRQYFRVIDRALDDFFGEERAPLVFAGVEYLFPIFKQSCQYNRLVDKPVPGNPDELSPAELQKKAWSVVAPLFSADEAAELNRYGKARSDNLASDDLQTVLHAARERRVGTLFMSRGAELWGKVQESPAGLEVSELPENSAEAEDLANYAAELTLAAGGKVYSVDRERMPNSRPLAAIFRYPA